jgi:hypothetical protein
VCADSMKGIPIKVGGGSLVSERLVRPQPDRPVSAHGNRVEFASVGSFDDIQSGRISPYPLDSIEVISVVPTQDEMRDRFKKTSD